MAAECSAVSAHHLEHKNSDCDLPALYILAQKTQKTSEAKMNFVLAGEQNVYELHAAW